MLRWAVVISLLALAAPAAADDDGAYGRLVGDLTLEAALGGGAAFEGAPFDDAILGAGTLELRARYVDMAGLLIGGELRYGGRSRLVIAADVRPLFLGRFLLNLSFHDRFWDLLLDSIGFDLGVALVPLDEGIGAALAIGFGLNVPLIFIGDGYEGLSLRLAGRHVAALPADRLGPDGGTNDWVAMAAIVLRGSVATGLTSWERPRYELPQ